MSADHHGLVLPESANNQDNSPHRYGCSQSELDSSSLGRHSDDSIPCKLVGDADQVKLKLNFANQKVDLVLKSENEGFVFKINCI